jgi:hypothetical protein
MVMALDFGNSLFRIPVTVTWSDLASRLQSLEILQRFGDIMETLGPVE